MQRTELTQLQTVDGTMGPTDRPMQTCCPLCRSRRLHYAFSIAGPADAGVTVSRESGFRVVRCNDCRFMLLNPQPSDQELAAIYSNGYFFAGHDSAAANLKSATARDYLRQIESYRGMAGGQFLEVGCGQGEMLVEAVLAGYSVTGVEFSPSSTAVARERLQTIATEKSANVICGELESATLVPNSFDVCVLADVIEHARDPLAMLRLVRQALKPDGVLLLATPTLDSWSAKLMKRSWMEFKPEHLSYFDGNTLQNLLFAAGFEQTIVTPGYKTLSLDYIAGHFDRFPVPFFSRLVAGVARVMPKAIKRKELRVVASGMVSISRVNNKADEHPLKRRHTLSVVVPAYNEAATIDNLLSTVLKKELPQMDIEVIVIESNSTDGTRQIVECYADHPRVKVILEEKARGKGHAVRTGLAAATGDFILIQDADLEYDLEDYDVLLEPLTSGREAFVLGSRHGGEAWWKMRQFEQQPLASAFLNFGHWVFTTLLNTLFGQKLKDPFTMYKVFRRDCLAGLEFRCNRFDFDYELLVKLIRKGYKPIEIPVNYRSRSFKEGKKINTFRDPINWLRALAWLRLTRINPMQVMAETAQERAQQSGEAAASRRAA